MKKKILLLLGISLLIPMRAFALENTTSVTCTPSRIVSGTTVTCNFKANVASGKLTGFSAKYDLDSGVSYVADSFVAGTSLPLLAANANGFTLMNTTGATGSITLGSAKFTVTGNAGSYKVGLKEIALSDENASSSAEADKSATVKILSSVKTLSSLSIEANGYAADKITNIVKDTSNQNIVVSAVVDAATIEINATPTDTNATVEGDGIQSIAYGVNEKVITVTAEDGSTKDYTLTLVRPDNRSNNNFLKSLTIKGYKINFNKGTLEYNIHVGNSVSELSIEAQAEDSSATIEVRNNSLKVGKNKVLVVVKAENETEKTYVINVEKDMLLNLPNTAAGKSILVIIISIIMIGSGVAIIYYNKNIGVKN